MFTRNNWKFVQRFRRFMRWLIAGAALCYAAGIGALLLLWTFQPQRAWWLTVTNILAAPLFLPLVVLVPLALAVRSGWLRTAVALPTLIFLALFGAQLLPVGAPTQTGMPLRVVTLNHWFSNPHVDAIIAAIRAQHADVVALQELSTPVERALQQLRAEYPYQVLVAGEADYGVGIISRYPMRELPKDYSFSGQIVAVQVGGREVTMINVHLPAPDIETKRLGRTQFWRRIRRPVGYNPKLRTDEYPGLLAAIDDTHGPLIVLGDHNTSDRELAYAPLAARMHDAWRETNWGFGFTFPNDKRVDGARLAFPLIRIDYVWSKNGLTPESAQVICGRTGSDHCLLVADLRLAAR